VGDVCETSKELRVDRGREKKVMVKLAGGGMST
jgi:hypothetical protein